MDVMSSNKRILIDSFYKLLWSSRDLVFNGLRRSLLAAIQDCTCTSSKKAAAQMRRMTVRRNGSVIGSMTCVRRVAGSNPTLAAT